MKYFNATPLHLMWANQLVGLPSEDVFVFHSAAWDGDRAAAKSHGWAQVPDWAQAPDWAQVPDWEQAPDWGLSARGKPERDEADHDSIDGAGAKPDWKNDTGGGGGGGGKKGGGKKGGDSGSTDGGSTDGGSTDGGSTDGGDPQPPAADYVSGLDTPDGFNISVSYTGSWTTELKAIFEATLELISDYVTADLPDHNGIDDLHITATLGTIDGSGGYWGWGGYTTARADSGLPSAGYITLDTADLNTMVNYDIFDDFVFHEVLHAMGFGTAWQSLGLVDTIDGSLRFTGANAIEAYNTEYSQIAANDPLSAYGVPVEMEGGDGTAGVHWDHDTFGKEMMTGQLGVTNVISDMTLAALEDMGYETVYGDALLVA